MPWGVAAAAGASVIGGALQSKATSKAADKSIAAQERQQAQTRADLAPFTQAGVNALAPAQNLLGLNGQEAANTAMANFQSSPGYGYQVSEGLKAVDTGAAARGLLRSGSTLAAEQKLGANLANQDFTTYYNRLMGMTQLGQASAAGTAAAGAQAASGIAQTEASLGSAQASIYGNTASGVSNAIGQGLNNYQYQQRTAALEQQNALAPQPYSPTMGRY